MIATKLWVLFYLVYFPSHELDTKIYTHWQGYETQQQCLEKAEYMRGYDNVVSAWCDYQGGMY